MTLTRGRLLAFALFALCLTISACKKANKNVTPENFAKIKSGMTVSDVEAILGGPGEDDPEGNLDVSEGSSVAGAAGITGGDLDSMSKRRPTTKWLRWGNDKKNIRVGFDDGKVGAGKIQSKGI